MRTEIREFYVILQTGYGDANHPFDPVAHHSVDLMKLPKRAKFGTKELAEAKIPQCYAEAARCAKIFEPDCGHSLTAQAYRAMKFEVAKVAITVDLLPQ